MKYTRIYSDNNGESCFEDVELQLISQGDIGALSSAFEVKEMYFRENPPDYNYDFHQAPRRQFIVLLDGEIEITTSKNESRRFKAGDILLVEDTSGKGHKTKNIVPKIRQSLFITL
jgi:hypothetical protein